MCRNTIPKTLGITLLTVSLLVAGDVLAQNSANNKNQVPLVTTVKSEQDSSVPQKETGILTGNAENSGETTSEDIPYKTGATTSFLSILQIIVSLMFVLVVAYLVIWVLKKYNTGWIMGKNPQESRVSLIEVKRLTPRLSIFLIGVGGETIMLAQSGDNVSFYKGNLPAMKPAVQADHNNN